jgi:hypothetical protein
MFATRPRSGCLRPVMPSRNVVPSVLSRRIDVTDPAVALFEASKAKPVPATSVIVPSVFRNWSNVEEALKADSCVTSSQCRLVGIATLLRV